MPYDPERSFGFLLHDVARLLRKRFDQRARALGLSRSQWQVLAHLSRHEGINQSGLAEILEIERMRALAEETRNEALGGLPPEQRETLVDMLLHVRANISERGAQPPRAGGNGKAADYA